MEHTSSHSCGFSFSEALYHLKNEKHVYRQGWNCKDIRIFIAKGYDISGVFGFDSLDAIYMKTKDDKIIPWIPSQTDLLEEDWVVL